MFWQRLGNKSADLGEGGAMMVVQLYSRANCPRLTGLQLLALLNVLDRFAREAPDDLGLTRADYDHRRASLVHRLDKTAVGRPRTAEFEAGAKRRGRRRVFSCYGYAGARQFE